MPRFSVLTIALAATTALAAPQVANAQSREQIRVVGSSTVYPFTTAVAENFAQETDFQPPIVESTGTGGGFQLFCEGVGAGHPDINDASRPMTDSERDLCAQNGVKNVTELQVGNDGIVLASDKSTDQLDVSRAQLWQALAAETVQDGEIVDNPYQRWSDIDSSLPDLDIVVFGPPTTSGTRDAFVELAMEAGCAEFEAVKQLDEERKSTVCTQMRSDGGFVEAGENDNVIVQRLGSQSGSFGLFGFSYYDQNRADLQAAQIGGVGPNADSIGSGDYSLSRPLFIYVKDAHVGSIPGLAEFLDYYTSPEVFGPNGFLIEQGLIPMTDDKRQEVTDKVGSIS
ncbi:MAG: substrate-binding domain-containing protein [Geminicoccaceae bacterium]